MSKTRQERDLSDTKILISTLRDNSSFDTTNKQLQNIINGVNANETVNVDISQEIGMKILDSMMGKTVTEFNFKRSNQAITLASKTSVHIDGEDVQVDPQLLFQRLILASKSSENMQGIFKYELCSYPAALFDSSLMLRQPQTTVLADAIIYVDYVTRKYGEAIIVFDGYGENSTKDMTQQRRSGAKTAPAVTFTKEIKLTMKKDIFLSNPQNKQRLLNMLSESLNENNCKTLHAESDADVLIAQTAVEAANLNTTVLVGEDTDLLILLCHHFKSGRFDLYFQPEPKVNSKKNRTWNIKLVKQDLGDAICDGILFIHAILSSDTTSHVHGFGKGASLKKFTTSKQFQNQASIFYNETSTKDDIIEAGEKALVLLYNGQQDDTLNDLRYKKLCEKVATNIHIGITSKSIISELLNCTRKSEESVTLGQYDKFLTASQEFYKYSLLYVLQKMCSDGLWKHTVWVENSWSRIEENESLSLELEVHPAYNGGNVGIQFTPEVKTKSKTHINFILHNISVYALFIGKLTGLDYENYLKVYVYELKSNVINIRPKKKKCCVSGNPTDRVILPPTEMFL
ncbi:hypothetical protein GQR58_016250 [Nymphon striatum]|nr:hypothetical protein GQR58_016250 [Nymphon striatum]